MTPSRQQKKLAPQQAKEKIYRYCAYQERSHQEVRAKLITLGLCTNEVEELLTMLITEGFLNEERFAKAFAGGKFRIKNWGRLKIIRALEQKGVSGNCITYGLREIDEKDYRLTLDSLLRKKINQVGEVDSFIIRQKVAKYAIQKGYEPDLVWSALNVILPYTEK